MKNRKHFFGQKSSDTFSKRIEELTVEAKHNNQWRQQYMEWERQRTYDFETGKEAGIEAKAEEDAIAFLEKGIPPETIAECIKLPLEKVYELQKRIVVNG